MNKILLIILIVLFGFAILLPWTLYGIGLGNINGWPQLPAQEKTTDEEARKLWHELREKDPIKVEELSPYHYALLLVGLKPTATAPGERIAWYVARNYNYTNIKNRRNIYWHLSGVALTVWLTRNWSTDQLLAKAKEIQTIQARINPRLDGGAPKAARQGRIPLPIENH